MIPKQEGEALRLLLAEDDVNLSRGLKMLFEHEGFAVTCLDDGGQVLDAYKSYKPDVCILDVMLPNVDGIRLCQNIRDLSPAVPIIMLSACGEEVDRINGLESGADDYITKPFSARELLSRIKAVRRRLEQQASPLHSAQPQAGFLMAGIRIEPQELRAYDDDNYVNLSPRELAILQCLYANCGKVMSRDDIMNYAWGHDYIPNSRALDQCMSALRKKLLFGQDQSFIETVYGAGYRYTA